jgi:(p)ppGpp synthase/HD superfamily hydrolase
VEDTDTSFQEIEDIFGKEIRNIVEEVTDDKSLPKHQRKNLQVELAPKKSYKAKCVKLADKLYNLRDLVKSVPEGWTVDRVQEYFEWSRKVINGCRGTLNSVEEELDKMFEKSFEFDGKKYPCIKN